MELQLVQRQGLHVRHRACACVNGLFSLGVGANISSPAVGFCRTQPTILRYHHILPTSSSSTPSRQVVVPQAIFHFRSLSSSISQFLPRPNSLSPGLHVMASTHQSRSHTGHSHHHHHDNSLLISKNKSDPGVRITRIGLVVNLGMAAAKGAGGYFFNSQALIADAFHSLTDLVSDLMTLATISFSMKLPTTKFPTGYGKIESLGSVGVSGLLLAGGVLMAWNSCHSLYAQLFLDTAAAVEQHLHAHGHSHGHSHAAANLIPDIKAAWLAAGTIVIKEWLYRASKLCTSLLLLTLHADARFLQL